MTSLTGPSFKPYKGTSSYQVEDAQLFFGRKADAEQLLARVLSARMTLLHAQSGAGKTSLVNATLIPELEKRAWAPVRILPLNDPLASAKSAALLTVMTPPEAEITAVDRVVQSLPGSEAMTLGELLDHYDNWKPRDPLKRALIAPVEVPERGMVVPYFCRLLRSSIDVDAFASHLAAVQQGGSATPAEKIVTSATPLHALRALLDSVEFASSYRTLLTYLQPPADRLWPFFQNLVEVYGKRRGHFSLILLFDQFEEMFTRFVDPGKTARIRAADLPDWKLRYEFFLQLKEVYAGRLSAAELPSIRFLVSMRSEYIAQMGPVREFAPELDQSTFHLKLLPKEGALEAIREPADLYGYGYTDECYDSILQDLTKEERFIEPAHLSLVCEKLWDESGRSAAVLSSSNGGLKIGLDVYEARLHGARGILRAFLRDYLDSLPDGSDRTESLELLEPLITGTGTRNIVERRQLVDVPFRNAERRQTLLQGLVNRTIVRVEVRLGAEFVEITHEFLIASIQEAMQEFLFTDVAYQRLRVALQTLRGLRADQIATDMDGVLSKDVFTTLHDNRERIEWTPLAAEAMLRASIFYGRNGETTGTWSRIFAETAAECDFKSVLDRVERRDTSRSNLTGDELRALNVSRDDVELTPAQILFVLRSQLVHGAHTRKNDIRYWAERGSP